MILKTIKQYKKIVLVTHINPDADTIGSALALYEYLKFILGLNVYVFNRDLLLIQNLHFLPNYRVIKNTFPVNVDCVISLDCGAFSRLGIKKDNYFLINIDHHISNEQFGDLNIIKTDMPSNTALIYELLEKNNININKPMAINLYAGLIHDTNQFKNKMTNTFAFKMAEKLSKKIDVNVVSNFLFNKHSLAKFRLASIGYKNVELIENATIAMVSISQKEFKQTGANLLDTDLFFNELLGLETVNVAIIIKEKSDYSSKVSLRAKEGWDMNDIAIEFKGGGHKLASGFEIDLNIKETKEKLIKLLKVLK